MIRYLCLVVGLCFSLLVLNCDRKSNKIIRTEHESLAKTLDRVNTIEDQNEVEYNTFIEINKKDSFDASLFDKSGDYDVSVSKVLQDDFGNTYIVGSRRERDDGYEGFMLMKLDENNEIVWDKVYSKDSKIIVSDIDISTSRDIIISGAKIELGSVTNDAYLIKINENGDEIWSNTYGTDGYDSASELIQMEDGSYFLVGNSIQEDDESISKIYLVHIDNNGKRIKQKFIDENCIAIGNSMVKTKNERMIFLSALDVGEYGEGVMNLYCYDMEFPEVWQRKLGETFNSRGNMILATEENDFLVMNSNPFKLIKVDINGIVKWERSYDLKEDGTVSGMSGMFLKKMGKDEYIIGGEKRIITKEYQVKALLIKTDGAGNII